MKINAENERIKHKYFDYCSKANAYSEKTIIQMERSINRWDDFTHHLSYKQFSERNVLDFKNMLQKDVDENIIQPGTAKRNLKDLHKFLHWLRLIPGYKSKIDPLIIDYLEPSRRMNIQENNYSDKIYPTLQQVKIIWNSIEIETDIDKRDRVIFSLLILTGIRIEALSTLRLDCFDPAKLTIDQSPQKGVKTKFGKRIKTTIINFDKELVQNVTDWYNMLLEKGYGVHDPLIPGAVSTRQNGLCFSKSEKMGKQFIKSGRLRAIIKERCAKVGYNDFTPHSFRHAHLALASKLAKTAEEFKAISMNVGHENIETTFGCYGHLTQSQVENTISQLNAQI
ncbi:MAG TPA: site-specific integrase [Candidatus Cloacimonadota bacterium]|nr:site-specific integrase [Candidatus Cloacimonadota bacterium]